ncbi:MAG: hypothetical protein ACRERU_01305 [Methylococcales bacterium]
MNESLNQDGIASGFPLAVSLGGGAFLGMAIGYFAKKAFKITLFLTGLVLVGYVALVYTGTVPLVEVGDISPHLDETGNRVARFGGFLFAWVSSYDTAQVGSAGVGAIGGFIIGWKMG